MSSELKGYLNLSSSKEPNSEGEEKETVRDERFSGTAAVSKYSIVKSKEKDFTKFSQRHRR